MKCILVLIVSISVLLCACGSGGSEEKKIVLADTAKFYPLSSFFKEQIAFVDLRSFDIYKLTTVDGKKDSAALTKDEFIKWADIFVERSFANPALKAGYKETVFEDLSTGSYTINYTPHNPPAVTVKNIDILLAQQTNAVKRIFIKSVYAKGDTTIEEQCNWKADKSFQVNRTRSTNNGFRSTELNFINWDDK